MISLTVTFLIVGACASWCLIRVLRFSGLGQNNAATPQQHHTHTGVIPRVGGIGLMAGFILCFLISLIYLTDNEGIPSVYYGVLIGSLCAFLLGLIDDFRPLGARVKLVAQVLIAVLAHEFGLEIKTVAIPFTTIALELGFFSYFLTIAWFVVLMNLMNLIDGLDGLAGGIGLMLMGLLAFLGLSDGFSLSFILAVGMAGSIFGFLLHNFPPAKVYMGDSGAYLIGFLIASLSLINSEKGTVVAAMIAPILALAVPIVDVIFALIRRSIKGLPLFRPDSRHIHHRILNTGAPRRRAVLFLYGVSLFALLGGVLVFVDRGRYLGLLMGFAFVVVLISLRGRNITATSLQMLLSDSLQSRQDTRNALYLKDWFIGEVDRADSGTHLWSDYHFILKKMGFCRAKMLVNQNTRSFYIPHTQDHSNDQLHEFKYTFKNAKSAKLTLHAEKDFFSDRQFNLICDIAVEAWIKGAEKWFQLHGAELNFEAIASETDSYKAQKGRSLYRPTY